MDRRVDQVLTIVSEDSDQPLTTEDIRLDRVLDIGPLSVDADGNYLVLGLLEEQMSHLADVFKNGKSAGLEPLFLVHKFASDGRFIGSYFARKPPASFQELTAFMAVYPQSSRHFVL